MEENENQENLGVGQRTIADYKDEILSKIAANRALVITGRTGCGKTTVIPGYILESANRKEEYCKILVSQPRRLAAVSNANRVADNMKCKFGKDVGYCIARDRKCSEETRLLFCTTAIITQLVMRKKNLSFATHIILDEVHERDLETDFLMLLLKNTLEQDPSCQTKVILMSATLQADKFATFFECVQKPAIPVINMEIPRSFQLKINYLPDRHPQAPADKPGIPDSLYQVAVKLLSNQIEEKESTLVFLPGMNEIRAMQSALEAAKTKHLYQLVIMHSSIESDHQLVAFMKKQTQKPKVILSTNIAESSLTIPDVSGVIDFCLTKYIVTNRSGLPTLQLHWGSQAISDQRAGRTGRVGDGKVWRCVHKKFYDELKAHNDPEMVRVPLETVVLRTKMMDEKPIEFLQKAMDKPSQYNVTKSILVLKELGAWNRSCTEAGPYHYNSDPTDSGMSKCGRMMASLPLPIHLSKLITLGFAFSLLDETVIIAACMSITGIIRNNGKQTLDDYTTKMIYADGSPCDFIISLNAYNFWKHHQHTFATSELEESWCLKHGLDRKKLLEASALIVEIKERLHKLGMIQSESSSWSYTEKRMILQFIIAGALYPYYFTIGATDERTEKIGHVKAHWCDLRNTIDMKFEAQNLAQFGELYQEELKEQIVSKGICASKAEIKMEFYKTGETGGADRVNIQFLGDLNLVDYETDSVESIEENFKYETAFAPVGDINPSVVKAIKERHLCRQSFSITVMQNDQRLALDLGLAEVSSSGIYRRAPAKRVKNPHACIIPSMWTSDFKGHVSHLVSCEKFYIQPENAESRIDGFNELFSRYQLEQIQSAQEFEGSPIAVTRHNERWKRVSVLHNGLTKAVCFMMDFGQLEEIEYNKLFRVADMEIMKAVFAYPPQCFEARLNALKPSFVTSPRAVWSSEAVEHFAKWLAVEDKVLVIVHSFINNVASVELSIGGASLNEDLIASGHARWQQETFPRVFNKLLRLANQTLPPVPAASEFELQYDTINDHKIVQQAPLDKRSIKVKIIGPFSELEISRTSRILQSFPLDGTVSDGSINMPLFVDALGNMEGRFLVASNVSDKGGDKGAFLPETSMMPGIPGIGMLVSLAFAPQALFFCDKESTRYEHILFGLGVYDNEQPMFKIHDYVLPVTIQLSLEDFANINELRRLISSVMNCICVTGESEGSNSNKDEAAVKQDPTPMQSSIKEVVLKILLKERSVLPPRNAPSELSWNLSKSGDNKDRVFDSAFVDVAYPELSTPPSLKKLDELIVTRRRKELVAYMEKVKIDSTKEIRGTKREYTCPLCERTFDECATAENHNASKMHHTQLEELGNTEKQ